MIKLTKHGKFEKRFADASLVLLGLGVSNQLLVIFDTGIKSNFGQVMQLLGLQITYKIFPFIHILAVVER